MAPQAHSVMLETDPPELAEQARRIQGELSRALGTGPLTGEYVPPLDIFESDQAIELVVDLPGVDPSALQIVSKGGLLLVAGIKTPRRPRGDSSFHLLERGYGRFARTVRFSRACDPSRATARLAGGELRISVPRVVERRGGLITIPLTEPA